MSGNTKHRTRVRQTTADIDRTSLSSALAHLRRSTTPGRTLGGVCCALSVALLAPASLHAQAAASAPAATSRLEIGAEERVRSENWNNLDFNDATTDTRHQWRFRSRAWAKLGLGSRAEFMVGLNNESRRIRVPYTTPLWDESVIETLYLDYTFNPHWRVRLGRQNLNRGDGFLIMDGDPLDGSRTQYCNGVLATASWGKSKLELFGVSNPKYDQYLPVMNDKTKQLIEWDTQVLGVYFSGAGLQHTTLEGYYLFIDERHDHRAASEPAHLADRSLHTLGGRCVRQLGASWTAMVEASGQMGSQDPSIDVRGWGTQGQLKKVFGGTAKPSLAAGWIALSGDDAATATKYEGWDPLFSRYPKWSEFYLYAMSSERGAAYWSDLTAGQIEFQATLAPPVNFRATYYRLGAWHPFPGKPAIYSGGSVRGDLYQVRFDIKPNDTWRGHMVAEYLAPGSFYAGNNVGWFFRAEAVVALKHVFAI